MKSSHPILSSPAEQLASDEALLDWCENGHGEETLLFWEPCKTFVVVGYANKVETEVNVAACAANGIPIFRRCSGGGTVLQGAGCLNYALVLRITGDGPLRNITSANQFIMERNRMAIETLPPKSALRIPHSAISVRGHTDLCLDDLKFSGNSQRRKKNFLLFHGTFLLNFDLALIGEFLRMPSQQPEYRASRSHDDFLVNLNLPAGQVKAALQKVWGATDELQNFPEQETRQLAAQKYSTDAWNLKL
ncbi:MAG: lipoate--protein ligase family protein [Verrucomicrobiales bacterium]|nr:lipoate--protein ligase family protein [Verrucomicrobiales bacterium]